MTRRHRKEILIEMTILLVLPPALVWGGLFHLRELYPFVILGALILYFLTKRAQPPLLEKTPKKPERKQLALVIKRWLASTIVLLAGLWLINPEWLFAFPRERPDTWLFVMFAYPLVSAVSQELLYRWVFFKRWGWLFERRTQILAANTAAFAWLHIFFPWQYGIPIGFFLCIPAGWFFAQTYFDTRSFRLVWFEHALYGNTIFTIGLGKAFYLPWMT